MVSKVSKSSQNLMIGLSTIIVVSLFCISIWTFWSQSRVVADQVIHTDIVQLQKIFTQIHSDCYISDFAHEKNYIDFLNVNSFSGSTVGSMHLSSPQKWKGPYFKHNPTVNQHCYVILKNKQGYFIVPDDGVVVNNGKVIGTDIILNKDTDMHALMNSDQGLLSPSGCLAVEIKIGKQLINMWMQQVSLVDSID